MDTFTERLHPNYGILPCLLLIPAGYLVFAPIAPAAGVVIGFALCISVIALLWFLSPKVSVNNGNLNAGRATIALAELGEARIIPRTSTRKELGTDLDARAFLVIRGWIPTLVKVPVVDNTDPTPYWLISTRKPQELVIAINARGNSNY